MIRLFIVFFAFVSLTARADTQPWKPSQEQVEIFRAAHRVNGTLTKEMHERFWSQMPSASSQSDLAAFRAAMARSTAADLGRQRAMWLSIRDTAASHKVIVDPSYELARKAFAEMISLGEISREKVQAKEEEFQAQLVLVAEGRPVSSNGREFLVTPELATNILSNLDNSYERVRRLLEPVWQP